MRSIEDIRETAFVVARKNRDDGLDDVRPMPAAAQLHFDALDLLDALAEEKAENAGLRAQFVVLDQVSAQETHSVKVLMGLVSELRAALAEKDETIRLLNIDLELKDKLADIVLKDNQLYTVRANAEIERLRLVWSEEHDESVRLEERLKLRDAEIECLTVDLAQSQSAITKLSREIWKVC